MLNELLADATGKDVSVIEKDTDRNNYMDALSAKEYGLVDKVLGKRE
jgi:ATP-dependent Clp protease protease subunit